MIFLILPLKLLYLHNHFCFYRIDPPNRVTVFAEFRIFCLFVEIWWGSIGGARVLFKTNLSQSLLYPDGQWRGYPDCSRDSFEYQDTDSGSKNWLFAVVGKKTLGSHRGGVRQSALFWVFWKWLWACLSKKARLFVWPELGAADNLSETVAVKTDNPADWLLSNGGRGGPNWRTFVGSPQKRVQAQQFIPTRCLSTKLRNGICSQSKYHWFADVSGSGSHSHLKALSFRRLEIKSKENIKQQGD